MAWQIIRGSGALLGVCALFAACASKPTVPDERSDDGLELVEISRLDELYVAPGVSLASYQRVMLEPIEVTFKDNWRKNHPELSDREVDLLRERMREMLEKSLKKELARGNYLLAEAPANDVVRVRAEIVDLTLAAPDGGDDVGTRTFVRSAGEMTLRLQLFDGPSGALIARARDHEKDPESQRLERVDRVYNNMAARRMFDQWAEELRSALDVAKVKAGARQPKQ